MSAAAATTTAAAAAKFRTDATRWRAVAERTRAADGAFVFAVRSTGVYCRPSCPSRRANRVNVRFFATCDDAERAGFRPCRRCVPRRASADGPLAAAIASACRQIAESTAGGVAPRLGELARAAGYSPWHFQRAFKRIVGVTPRGYAEAHRARALRQGLATGGGVAAAIAGAGFGSPSRAYERSDAALGMTPGAYRRRGEAQEIRYTTARTSLGWLAVAATARGVCAIELGDSRAALEQGLRARFAAAQRVEADPGLAACVHSVVAFLDRPAAGLCLPLDVRGTAFQHRVWQALRALAPGTRTTYAAVAEAIGAPKSVRAVARAIATNPVALAIPCHRVIAKNGALAGYRWGVERKAALLERELRAARPSDRTHGGGERSAVGRKAGSVAGRATSSAPSVRRGT
jgi:AraC family transcriptional regulator of adaptative response/methylated-DNA-[protein]-cysteine methyltransferase